MSPIRRNGNRRGAVAIETAVAYSVIFTVLLGAAELSRYVILQQKLDRASALIADLTAQNPDPNALTDVFNSVAHTVSPFVFAPQGRVFVSRIVGQSGGGGRIDWQRNGAGTLNTTSRIGTQGGTALLPVGFTLAVNETVIATEVIYSYQPWLVNWLNIRQQNYHASWFRPRLN